MNKNPFILTAALLALFSLQPVVAEAAHHLYVSPAGHDLNDGSRKHPLQTLEQALVQAREMQRRDTLFIHLADGTYRLTETLRLRAEDSGSAQSPTVVMADHPGSVLLDGGRPLDMSGRTTGLNWWKGQPLMGHRTPEVRQLWRGGVKVPHASLVPSDSLIELSAFSRERQELLIPTESFEPVIDLIAGSCLGVAEDEQIMSEVKAEELRSMELVASSDRGMAVLRVKDFHIDGSQVRFTFHEPESRLFFAQSEPPRYFNLMGGYALVYPGTWYQSPKDGSIIYDPDEHERLANYRPETDEEFIYPVLTQLMEVSGEPGLPVHHIIFRGITFQHSAWVRPAESGVVTTVDGRYLLNGGHYERQEAAVKVSQAHDVSFEHCQFLHIGATALDYLPGCTDSQVIGCHFQDIGGSAIATPTEPAQRGFRIQRNTFADLANELWFSEAIRSR